MQSGPPVGTPAELGGFWIGTLRANMLILIYIDGISRIFRILQTLPDLASRSNATNFDCFCMFRYVFANGLETVRVKRHIFKVLRNGLLRYILYTCPNLWCNSCSKVLRNGLLRYILSTCPNLWCNSCSKCYRMDCFGRYFAHVQTCDVTRVQNCYGMDCLGTYFPHVQTCDVARVQSSTEWTASVDTLHMSKPVM